MSPNDYTIGGEDEKCRAIRKLYWNMDNFVIFEHDDGLSPHFSDDDQLSLKQKSCYLALGEHI